MPYRVPQNEAPVARWCCFRTSTSLSLSDVQFSNKTRKWLISVSFFSTIPSDGRFGCLNGLAAPRRCLTVSHLPRGAAALPRIPRTFGHGPTSSVGTGRDPKDGGGGRLVGTADSLVRFFFRRKHVSFWKCHDFTRSLIIFCLFSNRNTPVL